MTMEFAYEPPKAFAHLAPKKAARTQLGWGVGEDGSIDLEHVMSSNPFAGKTHNWGVATIDQNGDIVIQSKGPGNAESEHQLPPELIQKIVEFYEKEGLNVRNIAEKTADFEDEHLAPSLGPDAPEGICPVCYSKEVYGIPGSPFVDCEKCGWHGDESEVMPANALDDPRDEDDRMQNDPTYNQDFITDAKTDSEETFHTYLPTAGWHGGCFNAANNTGLTGTITYPDGDVVDVRDRKNMTKMIQMGRKGEVTQNEEGNWNFNSVPITVTTDNPELFWKIWEKEGVGGNRTASSRTAGVSLQGAPVTGAKVVTGIVIRPDQQTEEQAKAMVAQIPQATEHDNLKEYVDVRNKGQGTSFPAYDNPYTNRGGSLISEKIEDHFIEGQPNPKEAADPIGIPAQGPHDPRNFQPRRDAVIVAKNLITDHAWAYLDKDFSVKGIITELGGASSHAALIAQQENMALIVGVPVEGIKPGDNIVMDPKHGTVDVNGGSNDVQQGDTTLKHEAARFVWSNGHHMATPFGEPEADTHIGMIMAMATSGQLELDHESGEPINATRGVVYDNGSGEYYDEISDVDAMTAWAHQTYPQMKSMEYKPTGANYQVARVAEVGVRPFEEEKIEAYCPDCEWRGVADLVTEEDGWRGFRCPHCGVGNPVPGIGNPEIIPAEAKVAEITESAPKCPNCGSHSYKPVTLPSKSDGKGDGELNCLSCGENYKAELYRNPKKSELEKLAPGKEHMKGVSPKRNRMYEHVLESVKKEHPEWSLEKQKEYAARTVNKYREEHGETKSHTANVLIEDTNGEPLQSGKLYLMHSIKYKVPDVVQLVKVEPNGVEAHIESDVNGSFPILISESEFKDQGYSFEPYSGSDDLPESTSKLAAHKIHLTPRRQQELINENPGGRARNFDKLNLEGTHYEHKDYEIVSTDDLSAYFL